MKRITPHWAKSKCKLDSMKQMLLTNGLQYSEKLQ